MPLKFYTNLRVVGGLTNREEDEALIEDADWVLMRPNVVAKKAIEHFKVTFDWKRFKEIEIPYPDLPFQNREEPWLHQFATPRDVSNLKIYERIK